MKHLLATIILVASYSYCQAQALDDVGTRYNVEHSTRLADVIVVGKVQCIDTQRVSVPLPASMGESESFQIANVKVCEPLLGAKGVTHVRIGVPLDVPGLCELKANREGLFFLQRHRAGEFYTLVPAACLIDTSDKQSIDTARQLARYLCQPIAALQAADLAERSRAACLLVQKYRIPCTPNAKQVDISAEESKLILQVLANAEWKAGVHADDNPRDAFARLGISFGPTEFGRRGGPGGKSVEQRRQEYETTAKAWLRDNAETYRIRRYE